MPLSNKEKPLVRCPNQLTCYQSPKIVWLLMVFIALLRGDNNCCHNYNVFLLEVMATQDKMD